MKYNLNMSKVNFDLAEKHLDKTQYLEKWNGEVLQNFFKSQNDKPLFLLHDGPPYANGDLHLGHFTNKALKDTLLKFKRLNGFYAPLYNGSDCHGLPVELAVEKQGFADNLKGTSSFKTKDDKEAFVKACYSYAETQVVNQMSQLKGFGVFADFNKSYKTTDFQREAGEMEAVLSLLEKGYLFQKFRPVFWCKDCQSSLAEAELEYKSKQSNSLTVEFKLSDDTYFLVWTTTPYTLPANQAVAYNNRFSYAKYYDSSKEKFYVQLKMETLPEYWSFVDEFDFNKVVLESPYHKQLVNLHHADFVENSGTGFVHVAPSFGLDDFYLGEVHELETKSYVNEYGKYDTDEFPELKGMTLNDASKYVLEKLKSENLVYLHTMFEHEYPHCWRHKTPLFSKTSKEWFMDLSDVKSKATTAVDDVRFFPENGKNRLKSMLEGRTSWCVSRNRVWGVPLPHNNTPEAKENYSKWLEVVRVNGLSALYKDPDFKVQTLDVWFDSGMTHTTVVKEHFGVTKSDLYLEGSDQHRGWFQSSLLTSLALNNDAPYRQVLTHGFVVDEKGRKFSKSLGNYVAMEDLLKDYSPDVLRVWALGQDFHKELTYSKVAMTGALERYKKFRNTFRFMLQNLEDFDLKEFNLDNLDLMDKFVVFRTNALKSTVLKLADEYKFNEALSVLHTFCDQLSVHYLDGQKDRLYCSAKKDDRRVLTQSVLYYAQHTLMMLLAPYLPYSMEEYYKKSPLYDNVSVLMESFMDEVVVDFDNARFEDLLEMKVLFNKLLEEKRELKQLSKNNEMLLYTQSVLNSEELEALSLMLGNMHVLSGVEDKLEKHNYVKCDRCWNYFTKLEHDVLCKRCHTVESDFNH